MESWLAERVGSLALAQDEAGVERFRQIGIKLNQIVRCAGSSYGCSCSTLLSLRYLQDCPSYGVYSQQRTSRTDMGRLRYWRRKRYAPWLRNNRLPDEHLPIIYETFWDTLKRWTRVLWMER